MPKWKSRVTIQKIVSKSEMRGWEKITGCQERMQSICEELGSERKGVGTAYPLSLPQW